MTGRVCYSIWILVILGTIGCSKPEADVPNEFHVTITDKVGGSTSKEITLEISAPQGHVVQLGQGSGQDYGSKVWYGPDHSGHSDSVVTIHLAAMISEESGAESKSITYQDEVRVEGTTASGSESRPILPTQTIDDLCDFTVQVGSYPMGQDVQLGLFGGEPIILRID